MVPGIVAFILLGASLVDLAVVIALVLTSTALGTLMPILSQQGMLNKPVGKSIMVHGAMGEVLPIFAMAILLSTHGPLESALVRQAFSLL